MSSCPFIKEGKELKTDKVNRKITNWVNCITYNVVNMIECNKENCKQQYIGETERPLKLRLAEHKQYIQNIFPTQTTGKHFNLPGHSIANMTITILEKVTKMDESYRKERESFLIRKFNTFYKNLNKTP